MCLPWHLWDRNSHTSHWYPQILSDVRDISGGSIGAHAYSDDDKISAKISAKIVCRKYANAAIWFSVSI